MNSLVELNLALILFLPWYAILGFVFWRFPRQPRTVARRSYDIASLLMAFGLATASMQWSFHHATTNYGGMWKQVLATSVSYGIFLLVLTVATVVRWRLFRSNNHENPLHSRVPGTHHL
ncbi:MAG: hypothetical protein A3E01_04180 [Gammaproteobacteria bacterium RIFCSPHIGHO2_12_FULL_63_22]|nr:MAG: hypothetical protein A3E01_04180 [Gammaproteobacteria bacterium RIFCSPHIGHO2_12_FULL_63_22]